MDGSMPIDTTILIRCCCIELKFVFVFELLAVSVLFESAVSYGEGPALGEDAVTVAATVYGDVVLDGVTCGSSIVD